MQKRRTVDGVIVVGGEHVVLIRRAKAPYQNMLATPGGKVDPEDSDVAELMTEAKVFVDEATLRAACVRELQEEIGLTITQSELTPLMVLTGDRDPRPHIGESYVFRIDVASLDDVAHCAPASDAKELVICRLHDIVEADMAFDHFLVIQSVREAL